MTAGDVYRALWRHKLFILLMTAAFVGATWYVTSRQTRTYEASALVRVQQRGPRAGDASAALLASQTLTQTYAKIIGEGALNADIRRLVASCSRGRPSNPTSCQALGGTRSSRTALRRLSEAEISGSPVQDLDLLSIKARDTNPTSAMVVANATPIALRQFIRRTGPGSERIVVVKAATVPPGPVSRQLPLKIALAIMLGLIFNGALALLIELFRDRLPEPDELGQTLGYPVLATIPTLRLHPISAVEASREDHEAVLTVQRSVEGEGTSRATSSRMGPES